MASHQGYINGQDGLDKSTVKLLGTHSVARLLPPLSPSQAMETLKLGSYPGHLVQSVQEGRQSMMQLLMDKSDMRSDQCLLDGMVGCSSGEPYSLTPHHLGSKSQIGFYGSYQGLLQNFSHLNKSLQHVPVPEDDVVNCTERFDGANASSPEGDHVDKSGYLTSESSIYDVASDDEFYQIECNLTGEKALNDGYLNLAGCDGCDEDSNNAGSSSPITVNGGQMLEPSNCSEDISVDLIEDSNDNQEEKAQECPCIHGNPYLHVISDISEGTEEDILGPWKRRSVTKKGQDRKNCRVAKKMGPIEIAFRNAPCRKIKYIFEPVLGITFDSEVEAYDFYNMYSWEVSFGIKKATRLTNQKGFS